MRALKLRPVPMPPTITAGTVDTWPFLLATGIGRYMRILDAIVTKRDGFSLPDDVIRSILSGYTSGEIPDYQMSALLMAIFFRGLNTHELAIWTDAMIHSGQRMDWRELTPRAVDKHSTGGVGDKISLPLAPAVAACGAVVPMVSGRGLGHTGGTLDKLESIPGFNVRLPMERCTEIIHQLGLVLIGQTEQIAPADKKIYALRDASGTVENIQLISSSIMSKKLAEGISGLVLDVKVGSGAFMKTLPDAEQLARTLTGIGNSMGCTTIAHITRMDRPLGKKVGNALEVKETLEVLRGEGPEDVRELVLTLGAEMLVLSKISPDLADGRQKIHTSLANGTALQKFQQLIEAQGGDPHIVDNPQLLPKSAAQISIVAKRSGTIQSIHTSQLGIACCLLGGGRSKADDIIDPGVGMEIIHTIGDSVQQGEELVKIHFTDTSKLAEACQMTTNAFTIGDEPPTPIPLLIGRIV